VLTLLEALYLIA